MKTRNSSTVNPPQRNFSIDAFLSSRRAEFRAGEPMPSLTVLELPLAAIPAAKSDGYEPGAAGPSFAL
jgi:hypothetical protein